MQIVEGGLEDPRVVAWEGETSAASGALKRLSAERGEVKSMSAGRSGSIGRIRTACS
jgi:hypothetical protein